MLFFGFVMSTQISRQFISSCLLLFAITVTGWRGYVWLLGAVIFHMTALPLYIVIRLILKYGWPVVLPIIIVTYLIVFNFQDLIQLALLATDAEDRSVGTKIVHYAETDEGMTSADLMQLRFMFMSCIVSLVSWKYLPKNWLQLIVCSTILYVILLPIPLLSLRVFVLFNSILTGYIFSFLSYRVGWTFISWCGGAYVLLKINNQLVVDPENLMTLWDKFDAIGFFPFYYLLKI